MTLDLPIAERRLRSTSRVLQQSMWLLFMIAAGLMMVVRRSVPARTGSVWIVGCGVLSFMLWFAVRDLVRKVGHRNTEDKIVKDVRIFLQTQSAPPVLQPVVAQAIRIASPAGAKPPRSADFMPLQGARTYGTLAGDPVVFEAFPIHEPVAFRMDFEAVLLPMTPTC